MNSVVLAEDFKQFCDFTKQYYFDIIIEPFKLQDNLALQISPEVINYTFSKCINCWMIFDLKNVQECCFSKICPKKIHFVSTGRPAFETRFPVLIFYYNKQTKTWFLSKADCSSYHLNWASKHKFPFLIGNLKSLYKRELHHFYCCILENLDIYCLDSHFHKGPAGLHDERELGFAITKESIIAFRAFKNLQKELCGVFEDINDRQILGKNLAPILITMDKSFLEYYIKKLETKKRNNLNGHVTAIKDNAKLARDTMLKISNLKVQFDEYNLEFSKTEKGLIQKQLCIDDENKILNKLQKKYELLTPVMNMVISGEIPIPKSNKQVDRIPVSKFLKGK